ncbi:MAG TPA: hypothetical protein VIC08_04320 [Cellvibrionaceae bacterium]
MNEVRRQQYLQTLGIDSYMPRVLLAHAPLPRLCELPVISAEQDMAEHLPEAAAAVAPSRTNAAPVSVAKVLHDLGVDNQSAKKEQRSQNPLQDRPVVEVITPVYLHVWRHEPGYLMIDDCPPGMALPTPTLLANILAALSGEKINIASAERMRFPVKAELDSLYSPEAVRQDLHAWLAEEVSQHQYTEVWLLGDMARYFLAPDSRLAENMWRYHSISIHEPAITLRTLIAPSLSHLLYNPLDKARLWQTIQSQ